MANTEKHQDRIRKGEVWSWSGRNADFNIIISDHLLKSKTFFNPERPSVTFVAVQQYFFLHI